MKRKIALFMLILISLSLTFGMAQSVEAQLPAPTQAFYVNDFANVIDDTTEKTMQDMAVALGQSTGAQVVVVTVPSLGGVDLETYSLELLRKWGIGDAKKDNGVLLLLSMEERKSRIEVGYGLEGALPDGKTGTIQDEYMIPYYRNKDYSNGMLGGFTKIVEEVYKEYSVEAPQNVDASVYYAGSGNSSEQGNDALKAVFAVFLVILMIFDIIFNRGRITQIIIWMAMRGGGRSGGGGGGGFSGGGGSGGGGGSSRGF